LSKKDRNGKPEQRMIREQKMRATKKIRSLLMELFYLVLKWL